MKKEDVEKKHSISKSAKSIFKKNRGFEANALSLIIVIWVSPILLAYVILKFAIIRPIKSLFGVKKK